MDSSLRIYVSGATAVHALDARVKLVLLLAFSVCVFFMDAWAGLLLAAAMVAVCVCAARLSWGSLAKLSVPLLVIMALIWAFNSFGFNAPVALVGSFGFQPEGSDRVLKYAVRLELILLAGFAVAFTTHAEGLTSAFASLMSPLCALRVPVDDVAFSLSLALRFIPMVAEELERIRRAQISRGACFDTGGPWKRVRVWLTVFTPLIVGLFRRAGTMACAMDARCYGAARRTSLNAQALSSGDAAVLVAGIALCVALALAF